MAHLPTSQSTQLTPEEALVHDFDHVSLHPEPQTHSYCLVVKILSPKTLKIDWIQKAMNEAWVARCPFTFSEYHSGLFLVQFGCEGDRRRVMEGQPWHFDRSLMIFAIPDGFDTILPSQLRYIPLWVQVHFIPFGSRSYGLAQFVADAIGDLIEVHLISLYDSVTPFMRVRVLLDTTKPLHRGMNVRFRKLSLTKWLKFLYEGIQNYCYHCGKLDHTFNKCDKFLHHCDHNPFPPSLSYKDVLRAPAKSIYKKSIFELSNSIPFEEQPSLTNLDHHNSQDQTNSFLVTTVPTTFPATVASSTFIHRTTDPYPNVTHPHQPQTVNPTLHCTLPTLPIMTTTTLPTTSKGKAPMYPQPSQVSLNSPPLSSLNINDPPTAPSSTRKRSFARQTCQVGSSVRSMLKRARASHADFAVVPSMSDNEETAVPRSGLGGGLLLFWKENVFVNILSHSLHHIDCIITINNTTFHLSCYYGSPYVVDKQASWTLLHRLFDTAPLLPWLIIGDFNDYLGFNDRNTRGLPPSHAMHSFQNFVGKYSLFPLVFSGSRFTWKHGTTLERLDWAIINQKWADLYPMASLQHLGFFGSDHRALKVMLDGNPVTFARNSTFRFDNHWLLEPDFPKLLRESWCTDLSPSATNNPIITFLYCSASLSSWGKNKNQFSDRIKTIQSDIERLMVGPTVSPYDAKNANDLQKSLDTLLVKEEIFWKQRSRVNWLKAGDKNTKYFHNRASARKRTNFIKFLTLDDNSQVTSSTILPPLLSTSIPSSSRPKEVKTALFQLAGDKAPGPDGFNPSFFQKNWDSSGKDLCHAALHALATNADLRQVNETILVLIPKIKNASRVKDFRPISLCSTLYKVVSKTIANRLKTTLSDLISHNQGAFLSDRIIFDNIIIANEVIHAINNRKHGKVGWAALKLDMEKAFDKVEWAYIDHILHHFGFPDPFISLILNCLSSVSFRLRINNCLSHQIFPSRGIRQGDPLSPYLFLLVAEGLSGTINAKAHSNAFHGISISRSAPTISHLLFADDSLLFTKVTPSTAMEIKDILNLYNLATGQSVNFHKSSILFSPNTSSVDCRSFRDTLHLDDKPFIDKYLGVPQCFSRSKTSSFLFLLQKASSKLSVWNQTLFSRAGKEVLLKAVIQAIPSYAMSCFRLPVSLCKHYSKLMSKFWWGSLGHNHKIHWKKWDHLCTSKFYGGLGFRNIVHHNQAMLAKQAWRILTNPDSLVAQILKAKYFKRNDFLLAATGHTPSFCWRSILWGRDLLTKGLIWKIGDGNLVNTSESNWLPSHGKAILKPGLSPPSQNVSFFITEDRHWDLSKLRRFFDEEMCNAILAVPIDPHNNDSLIWNHHPSGVFTVNSAYHLANSNLSSPGPSNPATYKRWWTTVWSSNIPPKIKHFVWKAFHHILPSNLNLFNRQEYRDAQDRISTSTHISHHPSPRVQVSDDTYRLSVDAALSQSTNQHGYGAVVTDSKGTAIATFTAPSHTALAPIFAEAEALHRALLWCQAVRFPIAVITSDCQTLVHRIQNFSPDRFASAHLPS
uniref:Reverse transcriptase domain-containing protein n=1 Tax=Cannabis sativa TaxID=3483 RepID=A0A803QNQ6_CANSA